MRYGYKSCVSRETNPSIAPGGVFQEVEVTVYVVQAEAANGWPNSM